MLETVTFYQRETANILSSDEYCLIRPAVQEKDEHRFPERFNQFKQLLRFGLSGGLNTLIDLVILNSLLWIFPTTSPVTLLTYNSIAYSFGAINSFLLNKYWTFGQKRQITGGELTRFIVITLFGIGWSSLILWLASHTLQPVLVNATVWANVSKIVAIAGTAFISYLGMRLWVFVSKRPEKLTRQYERYTPPEQTSHVQSIAPMALEEEASNKYEGEGLNQHKQAQAMKHSLSVVLPAYNEEQVIATTVSDVLSVLNMWQIDAEVLVVNDGSKDRTGAIIAAMAETSPQIRLITHPINQGYGAALVSGFSHPQPNTPNTIDSDGQFDIRDLQRFFPFIDKYDAVLGYRQNRQDTWVRKLNALGWKWLVGLVLGVHIRDIDCAFKLLPTEFLHQFPLETRGAMINAELLYKLKQGGYTYKEVGVNHLPRQGGRATGANLRVIARAFRELFISAYKWRRNEKANAQQKLISANHSL